MQLRKICNVYRIRYFCVIFTKIVNFNTDINSKEEYSKQENNNIKNNNDASIAIVSWNLRRSRGRKAKEDLNQNF